MHRVACRRFGRRSRLGKQAVDAESLRLDRMLEILSAYPRRGSAAEERLRCSNKE